MRSVITASGPGRALWRSRDHHRLLRGVYISASEPVDQYVRARAALQVTPTGAAVSHFTAARWWGGVVPDVPDIHLSIAGRTRRRRQGVRLHRRTLPMEVTTHRGLPVSTALQTFRDMATHLDLVSLVVLGDSLVSAGRFTPPELVTWISAQRGPGVALARDAAQYVRAGVDSPMETRLRLLLVFAGYPEPVINLVVRADDGAWVYRLDLAWPQWRLAVEYDGRQHATSVTQWHKDIRRRDDFSNWGWRIVTVVSTDLYADPGGCLDRLDDALRERGVRPPRRRPGWERHFPARRAS